MNTITMIVIGIIVVAFIIANILIFIYKRKFSGVKHYEKIRDIVTIRKPKEEKKEDIADYKEINFARIIPQLIGFIIAIVVFVNVTYVVQENINSINKTGLEGTPAQPMFDMIIPIIAIAGIVGILGVVIQLFGIV